MHDDQQIRRTGMDMGKKIRAYLRGGCEAGSGCISFGTDLDFMFRERGCSVHGECLIRALEGNAKGGAPCI